MLKLLALTAAVAALAIAGCVVRSEPAYGYTEVSAAPMDIDVETYPHTIYADRPVYYYRSHWYYREGPRWYYYREEPPPLYEYRQRGYIQQAPPAPRYYPQTPPAGPPAVRVP